MEKHLNNMIQLLRSMFVKEWVWRLFLGLQVLGLVVLIYADVSAGRNWSFLPDLLDNRGQLQFDWAIFDDYYWTRYRHNWVFLLALFGPFLVAKAIDWINRSMHENIDAKLRQVTAVLHSDNPQGIECVGRVKSEVKQIIGKRISGLVIKEAKNHNHSPRHQLFLLFDDGTYYEFYAHDCEISTTGGVVQGNLDDVLSYMADSRVPVFIEEHK
jgi:hypothetical protein